MHFDVARSILVLLVEYRPSISSRHAVQFRLHVFSGCNQSFLISITNCNSWLDNVSLKSLPMADSTGEGRTTHTSKHTGGGFELLNLQAVQATSDWLRNNLQLTIIGFDLVVRAHTYFLSTG